MRLSLNQKNFIKKCLNQFLQEVPYEIYLYGSRVLDNLKGGDIDLLVVVSSDQVIWLTTIKAQIFVALKKASSLGERRIDITFVSKEEILKDSFLKQIWPNKCVQL